MNYHIMTLFPEMIEQGLSTSIIGRAIEKGFISFEAVNIRDYSGDLKHHKVDDYTYGGGAGMLMQAQPIYDCYKAIEEKIEFSNVIFEWIIKIHQNNIINYKYHYLIPIVIIEKIWCLYTIIFKIKTENIYRLIISKAILIFFCKECNIFFDSTFVIA